MQLVLTEEGVTALEVVLDESLKAVRVELAQVKSDVDRARLERKATFIRKILQQIAAGGLSRIV